MADAAARALQSSGEDEAASSETETVKYCVTGATGYIGSWLVEALLQRGYTVHSTIRNPARGTQTKTESMGHFQTCFGLPVWLETGAKASHLLPLWRGSDRLRLFGADLQEEGSFDEAVKGCDGVFHVAASMEFIVNERENIETYVHENLIDPAIKGAINVLKSCLRSKSVKRVVFTSSISTITAKDNNGKWKPVVDESCQIQNDHVWNTKASGWVYALSKLLSEEAAFKFAEENGMDLVSIITTTVAGPFFTTTVPSSVKVLLSPITGEAEFFQILSAVNARMGSIALVHIEDICSAHIFLMQHAKAEGRYICCSQTCTLSRLVSFLAKVYPSTNLQRINEKDYHKIPEISSKKLRDLGFGYKHGLEDIIQQTIMCCLDYGYLSPIE